MFAKPSSRNGFDKLAHLYRWMEYLSFGPLLWRARTTFLGEMSHARKALIIGDGDGRFTAALLRSNPQVRIHTVDASGAMLQRLQQRSASQGDAARVNAVLADATKLLPTGRFDLVCSHFFLDCLNDAQCNRLASQVVSRMPPAGCWVVSEFAIPQGMFQWPARALVSGLYKAFAVLTGLHVKQLPDHATAFRGAGLVCTAVRTRLGGILRAEIWSRPLDRDSPTSSGHIQQP